MMNYPTYEGALPYLTTAQMMQVDNLMIDVYGITLVQMMENAGHRLARLAVGRFFAGEPRGQRVFILAGSGGNGGGALVCARHLANWGAFVSVWLAKPDEQFAPIPRHQLQIIRNLGLACHIGAPIETLEPPDLIVDGVIGYSLKGRPYGVAADLIQWANAAGRPILSLDVPSGVDATAGLMSELAIAATATMTLALPKIGLKRVADKVGELYLADIGVPPALYRADGIGLAIGPLFASADIVRLG